MSLIFFHRLLIAAAIIFCAGYAAWEIRAYLESGRLISLLIGLAFGAGALALGYYLRHLTRILKLSGDRPADR